MWTMRPRVLVQVMMAVIKDRQVVDNGQQSADFCRLSIAETASQI